MAPDSTPQIERRPMTTKQARRKWQKKGCPTISSAERRRLQRAAELEDRANAIHEKEKRQRENAKKRKEKEEREKEKKKRMGVEEAAKLPEGQLGLGQFFRARAVSDSNSDRPTRSTSVREGQDEYATLENEVSQAIARVENTTDATDYTKNDVECKSRTDAQDSDMERAALPIHSASAEAANSPDKSMSTRLRSSSHKRKADDNLSSSHQSTKRRSLSRSPLEEKDINNLNELKSNNNLFVRNVSPKRAKKPPFFANYAAYKVARSAPGSRQASPEIDDMVRLIRSVPSTTMKSACEQVFNSHVKDHLTRDNVKELSRSVNVQQPLPRRSQRLAQNPVTKRSSSSPVDMLSIFADDVHTRGAQHSSQYDPPSGQQASSHMMASSQDIIPEDQSDAEEDSEPELDKVKQSSQSKKLPILIESFCDDFDDDDLLEMDAAEENAVVPTAKIVPISDPAVVSPKLLQSPIVMRQASQRKQLSRTASSHSFSCDFSSADLALLQEEMKDDSAEPREINDTTLEQARHSLSETTNAHPLSDEFDFPGSTQAFASLAEEVSISVQGELPELLPSTRDDTNGSQGLAKVTMPPPPLPPRKQVFEMNRQNVRLVIEEDEFDCFKGSTQALLDL